MLRTTHYIDTFDVSYSAVLMFVIMAFVKFDGYLNSLILR